MPSQGTASRHNISIHCIILLKAVTLLAQQQTGKSWLSDLLRLRNYTEIHTEWTKMKKVRCWLQTLSQRGDTISLHWDYCQASDEYFMSNYQAPFKSCTQVYLITFKGCGEVAKDKMQREIRSHSSKILSHSNIPGLKFFSQISHFIKYGWR